MSLVKLKARAQMTGSEAMTGKGAQTRTMTRKKLCHWVIKVVLKLKEGWDVILSWFRLFITSVLLQELFYALKVAIKVFLTYYACKYS